MRINNQADTRLLEQRSRLEFHYPKGDVIVFVPFFENPTITESKTANLVEYNPLGRSSSLWAYTGAKSRKIKLEIEYALPHLMNFEMGIERYRRLLKDPDESQKELFTKWSRGYAGTGQAQGPAFRSFGTVPTLATSVATDLEKAYLELLFKEDSTVGNPGSPTFYSRFSRSGRFQGESGQTFDIGGRLPPALRNVRNAELSPIRQQANELMSNQVFSSYLKTLPRDDRIKTIDTLVFFVNIFRTSLDSNAQNPLFGPPLLRLTHGTMYQSIPCIAKSYNLSFLDKEWGYDLETLTPRKVKISIDLHEVRVGNFGAYQQSYPVSRDNLAGWESVINSPLTTDPGQQLGTL